MADNIDVSVVIRTLNEEQWIGHTIQSVLDFIPNPEIIIVGHRETLKNEIENRPSWGRISAVKENKIFYIDENLANNWGISSVDLLRTIAIETEVLPPRQEKKVGSDIQQFYIVVIAVLVLIMRRKLIIKEKT